jgi:hypothetical protein
MIIFRAMSKTAKRCLKYVLLSLKLYDFEGFY